MKGCVIMSINEQMSLLQAAFERETKKLNSLSDEEARKVATSNLIKVGALDINGNPTPIYAAIK